MSEEISAVLKSNSIENKTYYRYKEINSIQEKIDRKNYIDINQITDLLGVKVVTNIDAIKEANKILVNLLSQKNILINESINYYEEKRNDEYKSIHLISSKAELELQLKDKINELKQSYTHPKIYKNPVIKKSYKDYICKKINKYIERYFKDKILPLNYELGEKDIKDFDKKLSSIIIKTMNKESER